MKNARGFTLVEVLVVVVIITVLATIGTLTYSGFQSQSRDSKRQANANVIADSLEQYFEKNGEYPSIADVTNTNAAQVKTLLNISDTSALLMPNAPSNISNSIKTPDVELNPGIITYDARIADSSDNTACQQQNGGCDSFVLSYKEESGETVTINSRNQDRVGVLQAPPDPILSTTIVSGKLVAKVTHNSSPVCPTGTAQYRIMSSTTNVTPTWSAPSESWQPVDSLTISNPVPSTTYFFYAQARCISSDGGEAANTNTATDSFYYTTTSMVASWTNSNTVAMGTLSTGTSLSICPSGTTPMYFIQNKVDNIANVPSGNTTGEGSWTPATPTWSTSNNIQVNNASNPRKISFRGQVRCDTTSPAAIGTPYPISNTDFVISAPLAPTVAASFSGSRLTWTWGDTVCPFGTSKIYTGAWLGDFQTKPPINTIVSGHFYDSVYKDGMSYGLQVTASCGGIPSSKILGATGPGSSYTKSASWNIPMQAGRAKFYTIYASSQGSGYAGGRLKLQSGSVESSVTNGSVTCEGKSYRSLRVRFGRDKTGDGTDLNGWSGWAYNGSWTGGDLVIGGPENLISRETDKNYDRNTNLEVQTEVFCKNSVYGNETSTSRLVDRYGILRVYGSANTTPKPNRYANTCTGASLYVNGVATYPVVDYHCSTAVRDSGESNAFQQTW